MPPFLASSRPNTAEHGRASRAAVSEKSSRLGPAIPQTHVRLRCGFRLHRPPCTLSACTTAAGRQMASGHRFGDLHHRLHRLVVDIHHNNVWGIHLTGVHLNWSNGTSPCGTRYPKSLGEFRSWFRTDADCLDYLEWLRGLAASSARPVVIREDGGLGMAGSCVRDAVTAHQ